MTSSLLLDTHILLWAVAVLDRSDRFLIATARVHDVGMVTADRRIREWPGATTAG